VQAEELAQIAELEAERERIAKFLNELELYIDMLANGAQNLDDAIVAINENKDASALFFLNIEAKVLFDEVNMRAEELLENRTPNDYTDNVQTLMQAVSLLIDSSRQLGVAVFYIDAQDSEEFTQFLSGGKQRKNSALQLTSSLRDFIASLR